MGLLDMVEQMAAGSGNADHAKVAAGLVQEMQERPSGLGGLLQQMQQNGMGGAIQQWGSGQTQPASPDAVENGLAGTGLIDSIAQRTGLSPAVVKTGLAVVVPVVMHHLVANNRVTPTGESTAQQPEPGGLLQSVLGRIL